VISTYGPEVYKFSGFLILSAYRRLVIQKKVSAVIGQVHSSVMLAVRDLSEKLGVPVFSTQASSKAITEKHLMTAFRTHAIDPDRARMWFLFYSGSPSADCLQPSLVSA
jgi:hypothetical protein